MHKNIYILDSEIVKVEKINEIREVQGSYSYY